MCPTNGHFEFISGQNIILTNVIVFSASVHLQMDGQWFTFRIMDLGMRIMAITCTWNDVYSSINKRKTAIAELRYDNYYQLAFFFFYFKSFYFAESSRVVYSQGEIKRLSSAWCK